METKSLAYGIGGFLLGGLVVSLAATTFDKPNSDDTSNRGMSGMTMDDMTASLVNKTGDDFDKTFIADMILHHEGAVEMAKLSETRAKHDEIKALSKDIITAQKKEIDQMKQWQKVWGYSVSSDDMNHSMTE